MKVYLKPNFSSRAVDRVVKALMQYAPEGIDFVDNMRDADLVVLHVNGRRDRMDRLAEKLLEQGKKYAVIQYAIKSTKNPNVKDWLPLWGFSELVWSYYDLELMTSVEVGTTSINFYHAPLGVDPEVFKLTSRKPENTYAIGICGQSYLTESTREVIAAVKQIQGRVFFWGSELHYDKSVFNLNNIEDRMLAEYLNKCAYVSGLRRTEGFELPVLEGLLCGARPIMFDKPHYKQWFGDLAIFIPEGTRDEVVRSLLDVFSQEYRPVTQAEIDIVNQRFNWQGIISGFWEKLL